VDAPVKVDKVETVIWQIILVEMQEAPTLASVHGLVTDAIVHVVGIPIRNIEEMVAPCPAVTNNNFYFIGSNTTLETFTGILSA